MVNRRTSHLVFSCGIIQAVVEVSLMSYAFLLRSFFGLMVVTGVSVVPAFAQRGATGGTSTGPSPGAGNAGTGTAGPGVGSNPGAGSIGTPGTSNPRVGQQPQTQQPMPEMQRSIYLSGKVTMDDGTPPPESVVVERVCNGTPRPEGYTDSKGRFSFALGQNSAVMADASVSSMGSDGMGMGGPGSSRNSGLGTGGFGSAGGANARDLMGCEIRASLAGFRSDMVSLAGHRAMDNPDVGVIVLHRLAKVDGFTFSGTSAFAPKDARKAFEKGQEAVKKNKIADAEKEFQKAVDLYPKYAVAWYRLGLVYQRQKKLDDARKSYAESLKADSKYVSPYVELTKLAAMDQNWQQTIDYSDKVLKLNPYFSPELYFYSAVANLNLKNMDAAEEHAREAVKMDTQHRFPKANEVLGVVLANKQDFKGAAENLRSYLKFAPGAPDADHVKQQLEQIERNIAPTAASTKEP